jgi:hypothetical protein
MTSLCDAADDTPLVSPNRVTGVVRGLLAAAVAPGSSWTYASLSDATGLKPKRLKSYVHEGKEPSLSAALSISVVLGKPAINAVLAVIGYGGAQPLDEAEDELPARVAAEMLANLSTIATAAADGRFDHHERPSVRRAADNIIQLAVPLSSAGEAA